MNISATENKDSTVVVGNDDLIIASRVKKTPVINSFGDKVGHIEDLSIEKSTGKVRYALMSFGGFLGVGEKFHPLPWGVLKYDTKRDGFVLPLTKEELVDAPSYTADELAAYGGQDIDYGESVQGFYKRFTVPL